MVVVEGRGKLVVVVEHGEVEHGEVEEVRRGCHCSFFRHRRVGLGMGWVPFEFKVCSMETRPCVWWWNWTGRS